MGTWNGQFSLPTMRKARFPVLGSTETLCFSRTSATKSAARCWSCGYSPVSTMLSPAGPKIAMSSRTSNFSAAVMSAAAACCGVSKLLALAGDADFAAGAFCSVDCCTANRIDPNRHTEGTRPQIQKNLGRFPFADVDFILCSYDLLLIYARHHRHGPRPLEIPSCTTHACLHHD